MYSLATHPHTNTETCTARRDDIAYLNLQLLVWTKAKCARLSVCTAWHLDCSYDSRKVQFTIRCCQFYFKKFTGADYRTLETGKSGSNSHISPQSPQADMRNVNYASFAGWQIVQKMRLDVLSVNGVNAHNVNLTDVRIRRHARAQTQRWVAMCGQSLSEGERQRERERAPRRHAAS